MRAVYSNRPMNLPQRRAEPALKTLLIMICIIALMFGAKAVSTPSAESEEVSAEEMSEG